MNRWGDEVLMHHEFACDHKGQVVFGLPLIAFFSKDRLYEIIGEFGADGCLRRLYSELKSWAGT